MGIRFQWISNLHCRQRSAHSCQQLQIAALQRWPSGMKKCYASTLLLLLFLSTDSIFTFCKLAGKIDLLDPKRNYEISFSRKKTTTAHMDNLQTSYWIHQTYWTHTNNTCTSQNIKTKKFKNIKSAKHNLI